MVGEMRNYRKMLANLLTLDGEAALAEVDNCGRDGAAWSASDLRMLADGADSRAAALGDWRWRIIAVRCYDSLAQGDVHASDKISAMQKRMAVLERHDDVPPEVRARVIEALVSWLAAAVPKAAPDAFLRHIVEIAREVFCRSPPSEEDRHVLAIQEYNNCREVLRIARRLAVMGIPLADSVRVWLAALPSDKAVTELLRGA